MQRDLTKISVLLVAMMVITISFCVGIVTAMRVDHEDENATDTLTLTGNTITHSELELMMQTAIDWLEASQQPDGSWLYDPGITGMVTWALLNAGYNPTKPVVSRALDYILQYVQPDYSITSVPTYSNYHTAVSVLALSATRDPAHEQTVRNAVKFIIDSQIDAADIDAIQDAAPCWLGGFGYGGGKHSGRPDLSNTQFALMALHAAETNYPSITIPATVWELAIGYVTRCQNLVATNLEPWATASDAPSYNDGGFIYRPGYSKAGDNKSYGSMTAAGIWSLVLAGVDASTDARVLAALDWLRTHYSWTMNPGFDDEKALFYYYWTAARALTITNQRHIIDSAGIVHNWFDELATELQKLQKPEGYWINERSNWFWEDKPELVTAYVLLALETQIVPKSYGEDTSLTISLDSDAIELHVYDTLGRHTGKSASAESSSTRAIETEIPNTEFTYERGDEHATIQQFVLSKIVAGTLYVELVAPALSDEYKLNIARIRGADAKTTYVYTGKLADAEIKTATIIISSIEGPGSLFTTELREVAPMLSVHPAKLVVAPGETTQIAIKLKEVTGVTGVESIRLIPMVSQEDIILTVDKNGIDLEAGGREVITITLTVPELSSSASSTGTELESYVLIESNNHRPLKLPIELKAKDTVSVKSYPSFNLVLLMSVCAIAVIVILAVVFINRLVRRKRDK
jgi:squalene-hopene/tetraprenyl-beta-curcumene cyclase